MSKPSTLPLASWVQFPVTPLCEQCQNNPASFFVFNYARVPEVKASMLAAKAAKKNWKKEISRRRGIKKGELFVYSPIDALELKLPERVTAWQFKCEQCTSGMDYGMDFAYLKQWLDDQDRKYGGVKPAGEQTAARTLSLSPKARTMFWQYRIRKPQ